MPDLVLRMCMLMNGRVGLTAERVCKSVSAETINSTKETVDGCDLHRNGSSMVQMYTHPFFVSEVNEQFTHKLPRCPLIQRAQTGARHFC